MWATKRARSRPPATPPRLVTVALLLASVALCPAPARGQEEPGVPPAAADEPSPFHRPLVLQAHPLRGLRGEIVKLILTAEDGGDLQLAALAAPFRADAPTTRVPLFVEIDGASFLRHNQAPVARLEIYAYALGVAGRVTAYLAEVLAVDVGGAGEAVWQSGLKYFGALELPPGSYTLRVLVRNAQSGARGLVTRQLTVPAPEDAEESPFVPVFADPEQRDVWLPIRPGAGATEPEAPYPFVAGDRALSPAARPVLVAGRETEAVLFGRPLPAGPLAATLQLFDAAADDGKVVAESAARALDRATTAAGLDRLSVRLTPPELPPGEYLYRLRLTDARKRTSDSPVGSFWLLAAGTRERQVIWSDLRWLVSSAAEEAPPRSPSGEPPAAGATAQPSPAKRGGRRVRALARDYQATVARLATEPPESVRAALLELETGALGRGDRALERLRDAEQLAAGELAAKQPEALLPLVTLHESLYRSYRGRRLYSLVQHSRGRVEQLAELFAAHGGSAAVAADILVGVGGYLLEADLPVESRRLLRRALEHDSGNPAALFAMATSHEKYAEYLRAEGYLERLDRQGPSWDLARLRWALNLRRTGRHRRAEELLQEMTDRCTDGWVCALAHQELARGRLDTGAERQAVALLERGLEQMPGHPGLRFLLAHAYDRLGRPQSALEVLSGLSADESRSERLRYDSWSNAYLDEARAAVAAAAEAAREALGRAAAPAEGEG